MRPRWPSTRRARVGASLVVVAVAVIVAAIGVTYTSVFAARRIAVRGNEALGRDRVLAAAGLTLGMNVAHLDEAEIEARLRADPWVAEALVERDLPGTIIVRIRERRPVGFLSGGTALAGDGTVLPDAEARGLPEIRSTYGAPEPADAVAAASALDTMAAPVRRRVDAVVVFPDGTLLVQLRDGVSVTYGPANELEEKAASLRAILRWADEEGGEVERIDVSVPAVPTATLVSGSTVA